MKLLTETNPEVRDLIDHMTHVLGLPHCMQSFSVHFKVGEPIRVETSYLANNKMPKKDSIKKDLEDVH